MAIKYRFLILYNTKGRPTQIYRALTFKQSVEKVRLHCEHFLDCRMYKYCYHIREISHKEIMIFSALEYEFFVHRF